MWSLYGIFHMYCFVDFCFGGTLIVTGWELRQKASFGASWSRIFLFLFFYKLVWLNSEEREKYLAIQPSLATAWLLVTRTKAIHLISEFIPLFPVLLKKMRMLGKPKVLSFLFLVLIKGIRRSGESKIFLCSPRSGKLLLRLSASGEV